MYPKKELVKLQGLRYRTVCDKLESSPNIYCEIVHVVAVNTC